MIHTYVLRKMGIPVQTGSWCPGIPLPDCEVGWTDAEVTMDLDVRVEREAHGVTRETLEFAELGDTVMLPCRECSGLRIFPHEPPCFECRGIGQVVATVEECDECNGAGLWDFNRSLCGFCVGGKVAV